MQRVELDGDLDFENLEKERTYIQCMYLWIENCWIDFSRTDDIYELSTVKYSCAYSAACLLYQ